MTGKKPFGSNNHNSGSGSEFGTREIRVGIPISENIDEVDDAYDGGVESGPCFF